ncbi:MAG: hypothetical protein HZB54_01990 [Deltaproteobacteria bacterium]|nr:hypothetical protein [Deltaproteobacteria bacterium]
MNKVACKKTIIYISFAFLLISCQRGYETITVFIPDKGKSYIEIQIEQKKDKIIELVKKQDKELKELVKRLEQERKAEKSRWDSEQFMDRMRRREYGKSFSDEVSELTFEIEQSARKIEIMKEWGREQTKELVKIMPASLEQLSEWEQWLEKEFKDVPKYKMNKEESKILINFMGDKAPEIVSIHITVAQAIANSLNFLNINEITKEGWEIKATRRAWGDIWLDEKPEDFEWGTEYTLQRPLRFKEIKEFWGKIKGILTNKPQNINDVIKPQDKRRGLRYAS